MFRSNRRNVLSAIVAVGLVLVSGCTTTTGAGSDPAARRASIDANVDLALQELFRQVPGSRDLVNQARGVLVFHATTSGSFGIQAGAQSSAVFILFMTADALDRFQNSSGWQVGADASVTLVSVGANATISTATAQQPVIGFVLSNRGLMAGVSMDGTRISRLDL